MTLVQWQGADGRFGSGPGAPIFQPNGTNQAYALLLLQRSLGGALSTRPELAPLPQCHDGADNDRDGRIDFPADPDCLFRCTPQERARPECANLVDDDGDGLIDFPEDPGCAGPLGEHERTQCDNGIDDDGDGRADAADLECLAPSQACELGPQGEVCGDLCFDTASDPEHCGGCDLACAPGVACEAGRCVSRLQFEGIARDVPDHDLGGWERCISGGYRAEIPLADLRACAGSQVMLGCRRNGAAEWSLLAMGERAEVLRETGNGQGGAHVHNGAQWYYSTAWSMGFAPLGVPVVRNACDDALDGAPTRMCWHTENDHIVRGFRCGDNWLDDTMERAVWTRF